MALPKKGSLPESTHGPGLHRKKQLFARRAIASRHRAGQLAAFSDLVLLTDFSSLVALPELMRDLTQPSRRASILT